MQNNISLIANSVKEFCTERNVVTTFHRQQKEIGDYIGYLDT